jgi:formylglycine-generating enzyme required for sulfatase activity
LGGGIAPGSNNKITWSAGVDLPAKLFSNVRVSVTASDDTAPTGMALIPAGSFVMGATTNMGHESHSGETPQHSVYVSAFYMDRYEVSKALWDEVYQWATNHSYGFSYAGSGKAANHPAHTMTWYDAVKWCNARSEKEGRVPAYYTDAGMTLVYKSGQVAPYVKWNTGYRLPTEAEWEKAARGGASGQRFPWGNTITHSLANYYSSSSYAYDTSPTRGNHPSFQAGGRPYTSPVGYFAPNGYGLYDMSGNVLEWCWDWYGSYSSSSQSDPRGPTSGSFRVNRGGRWSYFANYCGAASRGNGDPTFGGDGIGFRSVLPPGL